MSGSRLVRSLLAGVVSMGVTVGSVGAVTILGATATASAATNTSCPTTDGLGVASGYTGTVKTGIDTWGNGTACTLVLYDTAGPTGYLGELYAMTAGNLASHWGRVTAEPVADYTAGQVNLYTATVYVGSTFYGAASCPAATPCTPPAALATFAADVTTSTQPVIWAGYNQWALVGGAFSAANPTLLNSFEAAYGWNPANSVTVATNGAGDGASVVQINYPVDPASGGAVSNTQSFTRFPDPNGMTEPYLCNTPGLSCSGTTSTTPAPTWIATAICSAGQAAGSLTEPQFPSTGSGGAISYPGLAGCGADSIDNGSGTFPWAVSSKNLTFVGEIPLSYTSETNRYLLFNQLLSNALAPNAAPVHNALVRIEDVSVADDQPAAATGLSPETTASNTAAVISYLEGKNTSTYPGATAVPFSVNVIPQYVDSTHPNGVSLTSANNPGLYSALNDAFVTGTECAGNPGNASGVSTCGSVNQEGYTHQESLSSWNQVSTSLSGTRPTTNPYDGKTGDDFEFFKSYCTTVAPGSATSYPPPNNVAGSSCNTEGSTAWVYYAGAVPGDSAAWAASRVSAGSAILKSTGWVPSNASPSQVNFIAPHYAMSAADYTASDTIVKDRYDRELFFSGQLSGTPVTGPGNSKALECDAITCDYIGQFFPDQVTDVYGAAVIPENLGDYEPYAQNNHPPRLPLDLVYEAQQQSVLTNGTASFFYDAQDYGVGPLDQIMSGIKSITSNGQPVYTFVSPATEIAAYPGAPNLTPKITPPPSVTSVSPNAGWWIGYNTVTVNGSAFTGATSVHFGANAAWSFSVRSDNQILAIVPTGWIGTVAVSVTTPYGTSTTSVTPADQYTYSFFGFF